MLTWGWWRMHIIPALGRLVQENWSFKAAWAIEWVKQKVWGCSSMGEGCLAGWGSGCLLQQQEYKKEKEGGREIPRSRIRIAIIKYLLFLFRCVHLCVSVSECLVYASDSKSLKKASVSGKWNYSCKLPSVGTGNQMLVSGRSESTLNHWAIQPIPTKIFYWWFYWGVVSFFVCSFFLDKVLLCGPGWPLNRHHPPLFCSHRYWDTVCYHVWLAILLSILSHCSPTSNSG